jgi:hypothetical protein
MKRLLLPLLLSPALACAAPARDTGVLARAAPAAPGGTPAKALAPQGLEYFIGSWRADAVDPGTGETLTLSYRVEPTPGGSWVAGFAESGDGAIQSRDMWGRDPLTGGILRVIFNGNGAFATVRSPGWVGDTLVLEGESSAEGRTLRLRETITRVGPDAFRAVWEALRDGTWKAYSDERVTRQRT